jgi:hypothetical protein
MDDVIAVTQEAALARLLDGLLALEIDRGAGLLVLGLGPAVVAGRRRRAPASLPVRAREVSRGSATAATTRSE